MDIFENLNYTLEEQCFLQLERLQASLLSLEDEKKQRKYTAHRLYKSNVFEDITFEKRKLDSIRLHLLQILGEQLKACLLNTRARTRGNLDTPTPVRDLTPLSSRSPDEDEFSESSEEQSPELIVLSSDEDEKVDEPEVKPSMRFYSRRSNIPPSVSPTSTNTTTNDGDMPFHQASSTIQVVDRKLMSNYVCDEQGVIHLKPRNQVRFQDVRSVNKLSLMLHVVAKVLKLIETNNTVSKRGLYYESLDFCRCTVSAKKRSQTQDTSGTNTQFQNTQASREPNQTQEPPTQTNGTARHSTTKLDIVLDDICCLIGCSRVHLHILTQSKGLVYGNLKFKLKTGEIFDCSSKKEGISIPSSQAPIVSIESDAKFILISEKDSVLQKILNLEDSMHFIEKYKVILFTARGYPDVTSRAFLNFLWSKLKTPILALTDADPHGLEIVCCYKFGCYQTGYDNATLALPQVRWLGLLPSDVMQLSLPDSNTLPLTDNDLRKIRSLRSRASLMKRENWIHQLDLMKNYGRKAELEYLSDDDLVTMYLPNKLRFASWL